MVASVFRRTCCWVLVVALVELSPVGQSQADTLDPSKAGTGSPNATDSDTLLRQEPDRRPLYPVDIGAPDPMAQRLCDALHTLPQTRKAQCCGTPPASSMASECARTLTGALRGTAVTLVAAEIDRCVESARQQLEGCAWVTPLTPPVPEACRGLVHGQLQAGATCRSALECRESLFCRGLGPTTPGVCAEPATVGTACGSGQDALALYTGEAGDKIRHVDCAGSCQGGRCAAFIALGGACASSAQCTPGTHCAAGRCVERPLASGGEACSGDACVAGTTCVGGHCVALKAAGEPCTLPFECQAACVKHPGSAAGTCGMQCNPTLIGSSSVSAQR